VVDVDMMTVSITTSTRGDLPSRGMENATKAKVEIQRTSDDLIASIERKICGYEGI
jgi:hypothetical protein